MRGDVPCCGRHESEFGREPLQVGCSRELKQLLLSKGRSGIFSTALPVPNVAAASAAIKLATPQLRARLWSLLDVFGEASGVEVTSPIVPLVFGKRSYSCLWPRQLASACKVSGSDRAAQKRPLT